MGLVMNQSKPSGTPAGSRASTPAKAAAPAGPTAISGKPGTERPRAAPERVKPGEAQPQGRTGKVVHDERGNAVWDWLKQTGRHAIESTTRMLRKLETPELKVEQPHEEELRIQPDGDACSGGGYDPYNQPIKSRRTPIK